MLFKQSKERLVGEEKIDKTKDENGICRIRSRINVYQPVLLPRKGKLAQRLLEPCLLKTLHGGVQATICKICETIWISRPRRLLKTAIHKCNLRQGIMRNHLPLQRKESYQIFLHGLLNVVKQLEQIFLVPFCTKKKSKSIKHTL